MTKAIKGNESLRNFVKALSGCGFTDKQIKALHSAVEGEIETTLHALVTGVREELRTPASKPIDRPMITVTKRVITRGKVNA